MLKSVLVLSAAAGACAFSLGPSTPALRHASMGCSCCKGLNMVAQQDSTGMSRRAALTAAAGFFTAAVAPKEVKAEGSFTLPPLPYAYDALEPYVDEKTMQFHHDKHFNAYLTNLNKNIDGKKGLLEIQKEAIKTSAAVRNNGGGYYNHGLFFDEMISAKDSGAPSPALAKAIDDAFGSMDKMKEQFGAAAAGRFGSGWAWLGVGEGDKLVIVSTPNQDNPLMEGYDGPKCIPILGLDVWEHAYYLKYQNRRPDYIEQWWNVVNWKKVSEWYDTYASKGKPVEWM
mmetsp:Transcript_36658/g.57256  ORF Transcript_36658/g.57256 Transcript_36658/m.57256 type:complete len:285 (+) Transcript_36658:25-879(+)